jgi:benzoate transport
MSVLQVIAVAITVGLNALDGFDVLSISFASPGIASEWGVDRGALGVVLSMELLGMAVGSLVLGGLADRIGRRPTLLGCLAVMALGMYMASTAHSVVDLSVWRVFTGLGIGGVLAACNAVAAEFSNAKRRNLSVSIMAIGYPVGAVIGGVIAAHLLKGSDWRVVFHFGAIVTAVFIPLVFIFIPESVPWLSQKQPNGALEKINKALDRMGHQSVAALPGNAIEATKRSIVDIFAPGMIFTTLLVAFAYFFHITTFYYVLKWIPKIVVDMHFAASEAAGVLVWANVGGAVGGAVVGLLTQKFALKPLTIAVLVASCIMVNVFGQGTADLKQLSIICACVGFFTNGGVIGLYAILAQAFPAHVRAFGTGFAIGTGRGGSVLAPIVAGYLFQAGQGLPTVSFILAFGSLIGAGFLLMLKLDPENAKG